MEEETGRDIYSYNIMMSLYGKTGNENNWHCFGLLLGNIEKAKQIFSDMDALGYLSIESYNNLLNIFTEYVPSPVLL
jgi:hypothetical protein